MFLLVMVTCSDGEQVIGPEYRKSGCPQLFHYLQVKRINAIYKSVDL